MSLINVTAVSAGSIQLQALTRQSIINRFLRSTGLGFYGTASAGEITKITDQNSAGLAGVAWTEEEWERAWARISTTTDSLAPQGEIRTIRRATTVDGGLEVTPRFTAAPGAGDTYHIIRMPHPQLLLDFIDDTLREDLYQPHWSVLSWVPDFDMAQSGTSEWASSNATIAKSSAEPLMGMGDQYLTVTATAANGYAQPANNIIVEPGSTYHVSAVGRVTSASTTASLDIYDVTNSRTLYTTSFSRLNAVRPWHQVQLPSTCNQIQVRMVTNTNGGTSHWKDLIVYPQGAHQIALPWWVKSKDQVKAVFRLASDVFTSANLWSGDLMGTQTNGYQVQSDPFGNGRQLLYAPSKLTGSPLFILGLRSEPAFTNETTDVRRISPDDFNALLADRVFRSIASYPGGAAQNQRWVDKQLERWEREARRARYTLAQRVEEILSAAQPDTMDGARNDAWR